MESYWWMQPFMTRTPSRWPSSSLPPRFHETENKDANHQKAKNVYSRAMKRTCKYTQRECTPTCLLQSRSQKTLEFWRSCLYDNDNMNSYRSWLLIWCLSSAYFNLTSMACCRSAHGSAILRPPATLTLAREPGSWLTGGSAQGTGWLDWKLNRPSPL